MATLEFLLKEAKKLTPEEKLRLADALLASLSLPKDSVQESWVKEAEARYEAYEKGKLETVSWKEVKKRFTDWK